VADHDWRITLLALGEPTADQVAYAEAITADLLSAPLKLEWMHNAEAHIDRTRALITNLVAKLEPDLVHANQFAAACLHADVPVLLTVHSDVLSWRRWTLGTDEVPAEWLGYVELVQSGLRCADAVVAVSRFLAREVRCLYGSRRPIEVIYNGWARPAIEPVRPKQPLTLLAGRAWDAAKNIVLAAEAAHGWDPGRVYLAGDQRHPDSGGSLDVPPPIQPLGQLPRAELDQWLARASIFVSPARYDPFGLLPLQAALAGCALLLSDIPSYRELWDGAALFFRSDDPADLRRQWSLLLSEPSLVQELSSVARGCALERYSVDRMVDAYVSLYAELSEHAVKVPA
jgi:glycosyltransferase involved in cell wall biosynthesis